MHCLQSPAGLDANLGLNVFWLFDHRLMNLQVMHFLMVPKAILTEGLRLKVKQII